MMYRCGCGEEFNDAVSYYRHIKRCKIYQKRKRKISEAFRKYLSYKIIEAEDVSRCLGEG